MLSPFEKQVLENQQLMMEKLRGNFGDVDLKGKIQETEKLLNPPSLAESKALDKERNDLMGNEKYCGKSFVYAVVSNKEFTGVCGFDDPIANIMLQCNDCKKKDVITEVGE